MPQEVLRIGVLALRRPPVSRWSTGEVRPLMVLPSEPAAAPGTLLSTEDGIETWYLGGRDVVLWSGDASHHRDNLMSLRPSVWIALRGTNPARAEVVAATVDPYEGEGLASDPDLIVDAVPMPDPVRAAVAAFVDAHLVEAPFKKRKRAEVDPNAFSPRAPRVLHPDDSWIARKGRGPEQ
jgi:hypothetical protein